MCLMQIIFGLNAKSSDELFMYIRKNNDPITECCGTPATIAVHDDYCKFRTTLYFRFSFLIEREIVR